MTDKPIRLYIKDGARVDGEFCGYCIISGKWSDVCEVFGKQLEYDNGADKYRRCPECLEAERIAKELNAIDMLHNIRAGNFAEVPDES